MMTVIYTTRTLAEKLNSLRIRMAGEDNEQAVEYIGHLVERVEQGPVHLTIAFCGLFSAGKSSLINALCQTETFATGAVPTTAIVSGVTYHTPSGSLELMDTPGIDSTDEAHQAAMESALHKADMVALVMDYQHVEAEDNLEMARRLIEQGKQLILVINQIDKHFDWELPFEEFRRRVEQTFTDYDIRSCGLFYTTTRSSEHNQLDEFRDALNDLASDAEAIVSDSVLANAYNLVVQQVAQSCASRMETAESTVVDALGMVPFDDVECAAWIAEKQAKILELEAQKSSELSELREELTRVLSEFLRTIDLAQISPYETTEKGRIYVESLRPGFKVGWIGTREKTANEIRNRLDAFLSDLMERTQKYLLWPLQNSLRTFIQNTEWANAGWLEEVEMLKVTLTAHECRTLVNEGALVSDSYPYQYVKDVISAVKRKLVSRLHQCFDQWIPEALVVKQSQLGELDESLAKYTRARDVLAQWQSAGSLQQQEVQQLWDGLPLPGHLTWTEGRQ